jgi:antitoxin ParD1/3/4
MGREQGLDHPGKPVTCRFRPLTQGVFAGIIKAWMEGENMGKLSISLDEEAGAWVQAQGGDAEAYVNELIHQDQERKAAEAELRQMLEEADASGVSERTVEDIWAEAEARHHARHG